MLCGEIIVVCSEIHTETNKQDDNQRDRNFLSRTSDKVTCAEITNVECHTLSRMAPKLLKPVFST
jgi:hypothetical protein